MEIETILLKKAASYRPPTDRLQAILDVPLLFVVGISGAGKDTVQQRLLHAPDSDYRFIVSHTTREPRKNNGILEQNGVDYHFIDLTTAEKLLDEGEYLETNYYAGNIYGTTIGEIESLKEQHKIGLTDVDVNGVGHYVAFGMNVIPIFLVPPDYATWWERLIKRYEGSIDTEDLKKRLSTALDELTQAQRNDYFYLVINDDLDVTVSTVDTIAHGSQYEARSERALKLVRELHTKIAGKLKTL